MALRKRTQFTKHQQVHVGERLHACPECDKTFSHSSKLLKHSARTQAKNKCTKLSCSKSFVDSSNLLPHQHSRQKP